MTTDYDRIERVIRHLDAHYQEQPSLGDLAGTAGLSEFHFHRLFSRWAGVTPKAFLMSLTAAHAKDALRRSRSVLDAALDAGLSGPGRLHDLLVSVDAVTPGEYKAGGRGLDISYGAADTPFGRCLLGLTRRGVCHLEFAEPEASLKRLKADWPRASLARDEPGARRAASVLFARGRTTALLAGTPFQLKVWQALLRVPAGRVTSYGELARAIGKPGAARAVGAAVGSNRLAYLVPCHRVIRETGALGGYRWGTRRKRAMLAWEAARG